MPLLAAPGYLLDGVFIGAAQTRPLMSTMLVSALCVYLPAWYLTRDWGNHGLWFALALFNLARGLSLGWVYARYTRTQRWITGQSPAGPVQE
jgi:MATE family multidrug resistance protein